LKVVEVDAPPRLHGRRNRYQIQAHLPLPETERIAYGIVTDLTGAGYVVKHKDAINVRNRGAGNVKFVVGDTLRYTLVAAAPCCSAPGTRSGRRADVAR
jgi:hypothetical protein